MVVDSSSSYPSGLAFVPQHSHMARPTRRQQGLYGQTLAPLNTSLNIIGVTRRQSGLARGNTTGTSSSARAYSYCTGIRVQILFKDTGGGRAAPETNGRRHTERGPGPSKTAQRHRPQHRPEQRPEHTRPGRVRNNRPGPHTRPSQRAPGRNNPGTHQPAGAITHGPHLNLPAPETRCTCIYRNPITSEVPFLTTVGR